MTTWREALALERPLLLPVAHDALTARLIVRAGFAAMQVGGFALAGTQRGLPDVGLMDHHEQAALVAPILAATPRPVLVDGENGGLDAKAVARLVRTYERMGAAGIFIDDQQAPQRCGHLAGKHVLPLRAMERKLAAALAARRDPEFFVIARTDAREPEGCRQAVARLQRYAAVGVDGVYVEGLRDREELAFAGEVLGGMPLATSILEGGGATPWVEPQALRAMGFAMVLYPTTVLFRVARQTAEGLAALRHGNRMSAARATTLEAFEGFVDLAGWAAWERRFRLDEEEEA